MSNKRINILVAEDNDLNAKLIAAVLSADIFAATFVIDGTEVLAACEHEDFDVILMDLRMPEMDGFEATDRLRKSDKRNCDTPIIAITADAILGQEDKCRAVGVNGYLTKPVSPDDLIQMIFSQVQKG